MIELQGNTMNDHSDTDDGGDGEGVWSPDIEQCFREALLLFPPCGRRKHILQEEGGGKMYGRNELIARHIRMRTGKIRTRKQVSSHIQVLARRKAKAEAAANGGEPAGSDSPASSINGPMESVRMNSRPNSNATTTPSNGIASNRQHSYYDVWADRPLVTQKIRLVEFSAFVEYRKNPMPTIQTSQQPLNDHSSSSLTNLANAALVVDMEQSMLRNDTFMIKAENQLTSNQVLMNNELGPTLLTTVGPNQAPTNFINQQSIYPSQQIPISTGSIATGPTNSLQQPLLDSQQHHLQLNQSEADMSMILTSGSNQISLHNTASINPNQLQQNMAHNQQHQQQQQQQQQHQHQQLQQQQFQNSSNGFTRHSYIKIDYRMPCNRQTSKLERIVLSQIQDKFPEIGGSEGLFQRGPSDAFFLIKFWANLNCDYKYNVNDQNSYFGFSCHFETIEPYKDITCSTKACSYGLQVVEKVEKIYCAFNSNNGRYSYEISRSPMCEFMIQFIKKLRELPKESQMNSVLENFTVLQEITRESTSEMLLCLAYVFEVASPEHLNNGSQYRVYKLTKD